MTELLDCRVAVPLHMLQSRKPVCDVSNELCDQDGKPYILRCVAGRTLDDPRNQGYSICASTTFATLEDMKYYDEQCEAHAGLKAVAKDLVEPPPLMMYIEAPADA